jgi:hypothetical protein
VFRPSSTSPAPSSSDGVPAPSPPWSNHSRSCGNSRRPRGPRWVPSRSAGVRGHIPRTGEMCSQDRVDTPRVPPPIAAEVQTRVEVAVSAPH